MHQVFLKASSKAHRTASSEAHPVATASSQHLRATGCIWSPTSPKLAAQLGGIGLERGCLPAAPGHSSLTQLPGTGEGVLLSCVRVWVSGSVFLKGCGVPVWMHQPPWCGFVRFMGFSSPQLLVTSAPHQKGKHTKHLCLSTCMSKML